MTKLTPISRFIVSGNSMFPTLIEGQDILSFNWAYLGKRPKAGDVVVLKIGNREIVKRVKRVEDGMVEVVGDNKDWSTDSREFGPVGMEQIVGKVIYQSSEP